MTTCIFCNIIEGKIPSIKLYEDENVYAFMDIMPLTKGHVLLVPKKHIENIYDFSAQDASKLFSIAPRIANALKETFQPVGMNLLQNNGAPAGQSVFHFHLHFIPRFDENDGFNLSTWQTHEKDFSTEQLQVLADKIKIAL